MNMEIISHTRHILNFISSSDSSGVYDVCERLVDYLEKNPTQQELTIVGLRESLGRIPTGDDLLIQAAFLLSLHPFEILESRYRVYDENIKFVVSDISIQEYSKAICDEFFIDGHFNEVSLSEFQRRAYPYFNNRAHCKLNSDEGGR